MKCLIEGRGLKETLEGVEREAWTAESEGPESFQQLHR